MNDIISLTIETEANKLVLDCPCSGNKQKSDRILRPGNYRVLNVRTVVAIYCLNFSSSLSFAIGNYRMCNTSSTVGQLSIWTGQCNRQ